MRASRRGRRSIDGGTRAPGGQTATASMNLKSFVMVSRFSGAERMSTGPQARIRATVESAAFADPYDSEAREPPPNDVIEKMK